MSKLQTIDDIKIPYPVEGIVRTAALDDTIAPADSVQLAVNMNFDRVGAIQTRAGITEFATSLEEKINSFGTLKNTITQPGYISIEQIGTSGIFTSEISFVASSKINDTHFLMVWTGVSGDGFAQVIRTNLETGGFIPVGSPLEFDISNALYVEVQRVNENNHLVVWSGSSFDGFAQTLRVDPISYAVTTLGTPLEFDTTNATFNSMVAIDENHFIVFYNNGSNGIATILEVDLGTFAVSEPGSPLTFDTGGVTSISCVPLGDGSRVFVFWSNGGVGKSQVFNVNLITWGITAVGSPLTLGYNSSFNSAQSLGDNEHFINFYSEGSSVGKARVFNVNPSTYAVTTVGSVATFEPGTSRINASVDMGNGENFVNFWSDADDAIYTQIFEVDTTTFNTTVVGSKIFVADGNGSSISLSSLKINDFLVIGTWSNVGEEGEGATFKINGPRVNQNFLYASHEDSVSNWDGTSWVSRRLGLVGSSKPRFSQFLNYIWMVNGNAQDGGDLVATSNGGAFGTNLVPLGFPKGDFIHGGFEGRVWVADAATGIVYYTDIVQFSPPDVYSLTYDPQVNFITTLSPQTGQKFTAMYRVPRALLIFTQDSIFRIYGATSLDSYPAYNVGTFSQESIIETKTGIFFHHSSGFYQFDYGSQPVEISRRIIDFVKAIPRAYYENVKGVYDGFDTVQWYVGPIAVEGVVFSNCVLRYTISTQVWTVYDYKNNDVTAMVLYDNGIVQTPLLGTSAGLVGSIEKGTTDFGQPFYYEYIDRWRSFTDMYCEIKSLGGISVYSENAAGGNVSYQIQKSGPNAWKPLATIDEKNNAFFPTEDTDDFDVLRLRVAGNTRGEQVVIHGIEIPSLTVKGYNTN